MRTLIALAVVLDIVSPAAAQNARIGAAAAVAGRVQAAGKIVQSGAPIYQNDRVTTDAKGRLQILLLDETVFTIGPNSDMTLDEFVYDPNTSAGKVSAKVTKGVFRFVTGKVAKRDPASMKVTTPVGTIGIRGTIAGGSVDASNATVVLLGPGANNNTGDSPGAINVANSGGSVDLSQPNFGTTMSADGGPSAPAPMPEFAASLSESLDGGSAGGGSGGSSAASGEGSVSEESGQETAAGGTGAMTAETLAATTQETSQQSTFATQDAAQGDLGRFTTWDQMRDLGGNPGGVWHYTGSSGYTCSGGISNCTSGGSGTASFDLYVDYDSRQVASGGASSISLSGDITDSTSLSSFSFNTLEGDAKVELSVANSNITNSDFDGSILSFENRGGQAAADAILDLTYTDTNQGDTSTKIIAPGAESPPL